MLLIGEVINVLNDEDTQYKNRVQVKIQPIHKDMNESDLPWIRPLIQPENEYTNLLKGDRVYIYTLDTSLNELYYFGKVNTDLDMSNILSNLTEINNNSPTEIKTITEYSLNDNRIKLIGTGDQLLFMNGEENFTLLAEKSNGMCFYLGSDQLKLNAGESFIILQNGKIELTAGGSNITLTKDGEIKIYAGESSMMTLLAKRLLLGGDTVNIGGSTGYVVVSPAPNISTVVNGMTLKASSKVKAG